MSNVAAQTQVSFVDDCPLCGKWVGRGKPLFQDNIQVFLNNVHVCKSCRNAFLNRRHAAYVIDRIAWCVLVISILNSPLITQLLWRSVGGGAIVVRQASYYILLIVLWSSFLLKDGLKGLSLGRFLAGIQVVDYASRKPIGFKQSIKRNLPLLIPFLGALIICLDMAKGRRWGDRWAETIVIWRRYAHKLPFDPRSMLCLKCDYNLTGNLSGICPECGAPIPVHVQRASGLVVAGGLNEPAQSETEALPHET